MFINFRINELSLLGCSYSFSIPEWGKGWNFRYDSNEDLVRKDYFYHKNEVPIAPQSILFTGTFSSGKTIIFNLLKNITNSIVSGINIRNQYKSFDVTISFYCSNCEYEYNVKLMPNGCVDSLKCDGNLVLSPQAPSLNLSITKNSCPTAYRWFEKLVFVSSVYDNRDDFYTSINKHIKAININKILPSKGSWLISNDTAYSVRLEGNIQSNQYFISTSVSNEKMIRTPLCVLNNSSYDLLNAISLTHFFMNSDDCVMLIDDIDLIAKTRFIQYVHSMFMSRKSDGKPRQLVGFSNKIISHYEGGRAIGKQSKIVRLNSLFNFNQPLYEISFGSES